MLLDNKNHGKVGLELKNSIGKNAKLSVLSHLFSIYGYASLKKELSTLSGARILLSKWDDNFIHTLAGSLEEIRLKNNLDQAQIAKEFSSWLAKDVQIKSLVGSAVNQNLFHVKNQDGKDFCIQGSSGFTTSGLGETNSSAIEINIGISDKEGTNQMLQWFDTIWNNPKSALNIKKEITEQLEYLAEEKPANLIYFITLYNLFKDFIEDIDEDNIIRSKTGFKETLVWNKLYKFQKDGVLGAIDKLERYNGCIIADSVGLGKTFEALAVIKYYELRNDRILVLCPKKLRDNWTVFTINDKRNILSADRFNYDVLNHTDLSRTSGKSGEVNLETLNWENYDLIVIDESHNFKNAGTKTGAISRYQKLMDQVIRAGVKTKVLMLSATPVNSRMNDLKNQVAFITEGKDNALSDHGIASIENTLKIAQTKFNEWLKLPDGQRKTASLLEKMNFGYFKLLDILTIARSRKHIEKYYDVAEIGKFPERLKPKNIKADIDIDGKFPPLKDVNMTIKKLNLAAYAPLEYVRMDKQEEYSRKYDQAVKDGASVFRQVDRERNMIHLMRVNMLKRMESSINSFHITVERLQNKIGNLLSQIQDQENSEFEELSIEDIETDSSEFEEYLIGNKIKVLIQDIDLIRWKQDLEEDYKLLGILVEEAKKIDATKDAKLQKLKEVISDKIANPLNENNKKVIIFTAFSDTAQYLYKNISPWVKEKHKIHSALVTGSGLNQCSDKNIGKDLNNILTNFSPISKERNKIDSEATNHIDILIATDCISEGQNLQDCDMLINYDIHWNPVRIIQRFGRVDRLGSHNDKIQLANFWPNMELDEYINLEARVSGRMVLLDISATGEENVIDYDETRQMNDLEYRRNQMKQLQDAVIDIEDIDGSVSITDMTLNDFRMDLSSFMKDNLTVLEKSPSGFFAAISGNLDEIPEGTIFCLRDIHKEVSENSNYSLAPYYMVYVASDGNIILNHLQSKKILDIFKKLCGGAKSLDENAIKNLKEATKNGKDMSSYKFMLEAAISNISGKNDEKGVESLFNRGGTILSQDSFKGIEDFEVISFLIIKEQKS